MGGVGRAMVAFLAGCAVPNSPTTPDAGPEPVAPEVPTIELRGVPDNTPPEAGLFVAGDFNGWSPGAPQARMERLASGAYRLALPGLSGRAEYKFTRGAWSSVEKGHALEELPNRVAVFEPDHPRSVAYVERWADLPPAASTTHGRVDLWPDVEVPGIRGRRAIRVLLPEGYDRTDARYPVLYMYDGQNLFDRVTAAFGTEWRADETLGALVGEGRLAPFIVVGIDNTADRGCDYNPFPGDPHPLCASGEPLGAAVNDFVANVLKPRVDARLRTMPDTAHTAVAGSSMGGQMALHAAIAHPGVFSRVAALSPSFQNTRSGAFSMPAFIRDRGAHALRVHLDMGDAEQIRDLDAAFLVARLHTVAEALRRSGATVREAVIPGGRHHESDWAARFGEVATWLWEP